MTVTFLASGSSGNSTVVAKDGKYILVDAGLSKKEVLRRLRQTGQTGMHCQGIVLTHNHGDHARHGASIARQFHCRLADFSAEYPFGVFAGLQVTAVATPHCANSYGFYIKDGGNALSIFTDLGAITSDIGRCLEASHTIAIEADYSEQMLAQSNYKPSLKRRIESTHLSNTALVQFFSRWTGGNARVKRVVLLHVSPRTNLPELAQALVKKVVPSHVEVLVAGTEPLGPLEV